MITLLSAFWDDVTPKVLFSLGLFGVNAHYGTVFIKLYLIRRVHSIFGGIIMALPTCFACQPDNLSLVTFFSHKKITFRFNQDYNRLDREWASERACVFSLPQALMLQVPKIGPGYTPQACFHLILLF